jgi:hypothetical protein
MNISLFPDKELAIEVEKELNKRGLGDKSYMRDYLLGCTMTADMTIEEFEVIDIIKASLNKTANEKPIYMETGTEAGWEAKMVIWETHYRTRQVLGGNNIDAFRALSPKK